MACQAWKYFKKDGDSTAVCLVVKNGIECNTAVNMKQGNTTGIWNHLDRHHKSNKEILALVRNRKTSRNVQNWQKRSADEMGESSASSESHQQPAVKQSKIQEAFEKVLI